MKDCNLQLKKKEKLVNSFKSFFIEKAPAVSPPKVSLSTVSFFSVTAGVCILMDFRDSFACFGL